MKNTANASINIFLNGFRIIEFDTNLILNFSQTIFRGKTAFKFLVAFSIIFYEKTN